MNARGNSWRIWGSTLKAEQLNPQPYRHEYDMVTSTLSIMSVNLILDDPRWMMPTRYMSENQEQLLRTLHDVQTQLAAKERQCIELTRTLSILTSRELPEREKENREIILINRILRIFAVSKDDEGLFEQVLAIVLDGLDSRHGVFGYIAEPGHLICPSLSKMLTECEIEGKCIHYPPEKWKGLWARALLKKRSFFINKPSPVPDGHPAINNNLAAPILFQGEVIGLLNLANKQSDYTETDLALVDAMADRIAPLLYAWIQKKSREKERARAEEELRESEERVRRKLESVLSPEGDLGVLELADLIDAQALQKLMDDFYALARIPMSIIDVKGKILVGVGWQEICTRFHRIQPDTCRHCVESDTHLSAGLAQGESRLYKCRNSMWDMATPIVVAGQHVGNIFTGQFFFEDETVDRDAFRAQARTYGFNEADYLAALDRVPRLNRETVDRGMSFFLKLADTLSQQGYSNINLARLLSERDRLTDSLQESRAKLESALASMTDAVFISDAQGRFIDFNDAFATFHKFKNKQECLTTLADYPDILDIFLPDGSLAPLERWPVPRALRGETGTNAEYTLRRRDTGETWVGSYSFAPIRNKEGVIVGSVGVGRDITQLKQAEEALRQSASFYRQTLESIPGMVFTTRPDGYCDYQSQQWVEYTGVPMSEHLGSGWSRLLHPEDRPRALAAWQAAVEGKAAYDLEYRVRRHDGAYEWFKVIGRPIRDGHGRIARWFGVSMNIEELKQAGEALRQLNGTLELKVAERTELAEDRSKQLQALAVDLIETEERERRRFAHLLHDDLQQMLAAAKMQLQAVSDHLPHDAMLKSVGQILNESIAITRRLSHDLSPAVLHHSGLIAGLQWLSGQMKKQFGLDVHLEANAAPPLESTVLKVFLFRAVQELLFNIIKHAGVKSARVTISSADDGIILSVSDHGKGFNIETLKQFREKAGFGLMSIRERAGYIGGSITIDSSPGKGSQFTLTIPLHLAAKALKRNHPTADPQDRASNPPVASSGGTRVLFADDHHVMRQGLIKLIIGQPNIQVVGEAANGREALDQARHLRPDVVVMDVSMPVMDGVEATRCIKAELPEVRVIGLSMYEDEHIVRTMREAGADAFVSKTISSAELLKAIYGEH
jgi:PAS domain S-box-containing protein